MKTPFKTKFVDGVESVMPVDGMAIKEVRYNQQTREINLIIDDTYTLEDLDALPWQTVKALVVQNGEKWESKKAGIEFLIGRKKNAS